jgi:hypothetical protein
MSQASLLVGGLRIERQFRMVCQNARLKCRPAACGAWIGEGDRPAWFGKRSARTENKIVFVIAKVSLDWVAVSVSMALINSAATARLSHWNQIQSAQPGRCRREIGGQFGFSMSRATFSLHAGTRVIGFLGLPFPHQIDKLGICFVREDNLQSYQEIARSPLRGGQALTAQP